MSTSEAYESTKQQAQEVGERMRESTQRAGGQAQEKIREQIDTRTTQLGEQVSATASDLRSVGEQGNEGPARIADTAADRVEQFGDYLKGVDSDRLLSDLESFARQRPWVVAAAGLTLGFVGSRLLKVSSGERYRASQFSQGSSPGREFPSYPASSEPYDRATDVADPLVAPVGVEVSRTPAPERVEVDDPGESRSTYSTESSERVYPGPLSEEEVVEGRDDVRSSPRSPGL